MSSVRGGGTAGPALILERSCDLFRDRGYADTSMADIAAACGLTKAGIYHHFASKEAILEGVLNQLDRDFLGPLADLGRDPGAMAAFTVSFFEHSGGCVAAQTAMETARRADGPRRRLEAFFLRWRDLVAAALPAAAGQTPATRAEDWIARVEGAVLWLKFFGDPGPLRRAGEALAGGKV
ncbi:MAG TPA: helix-turn-helix domain-containing protein [Azospirillaceae bacterium]|nr:helix-turn-helix domain-containing protein [Azospirillaceae bacterium]